MKSTLFGAVGGTLIAVLVGSVFGHESSVFAQTSIGIRSVGHVDRLYQPGRTTPGSKSR